MIGGAVLAKDHARGAFARKAQPRHLGPCHDPQIGAAAHRVKKGAARVPAQAAALVHLEIAGTLIVAAVEIIAARNAQLARGLGHGIEDGPSQALAFHAQFARLAMRRIGPAMIAFGAFEIGQNIVPAPAGIAHLPP